MEKYGIENEKSLSERQKEFISKAIDKGFEIKEYSGRGMFGEYCPSISVDYLSDFKEYEDYWWDNLGLGYVIYCRN